MGDKLERVLEDEIADLDIGEDVTESEQTVEGSADAGEIVEPIAAETGESEGVEDSKEEVVEEVVSETEPVKEVQEISTDDQMKNLLAQVDSLSRRVMELQNTEPQTQQTKTETKQEISSEIPDYLNGIDIDDLTTDPKIFNRFMAQFEQRITNAAMEQIKKETLLAIPDVVNFQIKQQSAMDSLVKEFYEANADLVGVKNTVAMVAQNVATENSDWTVKQVFEEAAKRTRELLKLNMPNSTGQKELTPAFAENIKTRHRQPQFELSDLQRQLDEL